MLFRAIGYIWSLMIYKKLTAVSLIDPSILASPFAKGVRVVLSTFPWGKGQMLMRQLFECKQFVHQNSPSGSGWISLWNCKLLGSFSQDWIEICRMQRTSWQETETASANLFSVFRDHYDFQFLSIPKIYMLNYDWDTKSLGRTYTHS